MSTFDLENYYEYLCMSQKQNAVMFSRTRGKYVPVRSAAASLLLTVLEYITAFFSRINRNF